METEVQMVPEVKTETEKPNRNEIIHTEMGVQIDFRLL